MIDFNNIEEAKLNNFKGGNGTALAKICQIGSTKIIQMKLKKDVSIGRHIHDSSCESIYVLSGIATIFHNDKLETLQKGQVHFCDKGETHEVINNYDDDLIMYCVVCEQ